MALLRQIAGAKGSAVICVTHDQRMVEGFNHVYRVKDGLVSPMDRPRGITEPPSGRCRWGPRLNFAK